MFRNEPVYIIHVLWTNIRGVLYDLEEKIPILINDNKNVCQLGDLKCYLSFSLQTVQSKANTLLVYLNLSFRPK